MTPPALDDFAEHQQATFLMITQLRRSSGEEITVDDIIEEYYLRDVAMQSSLQSVQH